MPSAPEISFAVPKRVPFDDTIAEMWVDYTGADVLMEVRGEPGGSGDPMLSLAESIAEAEGIEITYDPDYVDPDGGEPGASLIRIIIDEETLEGLPYGADPEDPVELCYDLQLTPVGGKKFVFCQGRFIVKPGVTL